MALAELFFGKEKTIFHLSKSAYPILHRWKTMNRSLSKLTGQSFNLPCLVFHTILIVLLLTVMATKGFTSTIKPFSSDGCSAFPDGTPWQQQLWLSCCHHHDFAYWKGGTYLERKEADHELQRCVATIGEPEIANLMLAGVRVGGTPFLPTSFRWGYGWPYPRFYRKLSLEEQKAVDKSLAENPQVISHLENTQ